MQSADLEKGIRLKSANGAMIQFQICRVFCICNCLRVDLAFRDAKRMDWVLIVLRHTHTLTARHISGFFPRVFVWFGCRVEWF